MPPFGAANHQILIQFSIGSHRLASMALTLRLSGNGQYALFIRIMWLNRMFKDRQEILVVGELILFLGAWGLCIAAAIDDYQVRHNGNADNNVAANSDFLSPGLPSAGGELE